MAISTVTCTINGSTYPLTYNSSSGKWEATLTAPGATSYNLSGGYYNVAVTATNTAGTVGTADASSLDGLKLVVRETVPPVVTILSPTSGAYVSNSRQPVTFTITDETGGSGVDLSTLVVKLDGTTQASGTISSTEIAGGYRCVYTPAAAVSDGSHTVTVNCSDHDGNAATQASTTYKIDTVPPTLNITAPAQGAILASTSCTVRGTTNDATSSPVTVAISVNGAAVATPTVGGDGTFTASVTLTTGSNTITITATDASGQSSTVTRTVTVDTSAPRITAATITPNPADTGATMIISVTITEG